MFDSAQLPGVHGQENPNAFPKPSMCCILSYSKQTNKQSIFFVRNKNPLGLLVQPFFH